MGQGELFALPAALATRLLACKDDGQFMELVEEIEETTEEGYRQPCWKEWVAIHHCLTGGTQDPKGGPPLLHQCFLGSQHLTDPNGGYMVALLLPAEVQPLAAALAALDAGWLQRRYLALFGSEWERPIPMDHLAALTRLFDEIRGFHSRAAAAHCAVLFTTDEILNDIYRTP